MATTLRCLTEGLFSKAKKKAKDFLKATKKTLTNIKKSIVKDKKKYTTKKTASTFKAGNLLTFRYNALDQTKKYDKNPLIVCLGSPRDNSRHTLGLNLHWLPQNQRVLLASLVIEMLEKRKGVLYYEDIKPLLKKFEGSPILRRYAIRRISNSVISMPQDMYLASASISYAEWSYGYGGKEV